MNLFRILPGFRDCRGVMTVKNTAGLDIFQMRCVLPWGHFGPHMDVRGSHWYNYVDMRDDLSKRLDNPNANSATGQNGRKVFILGPGNSLRKK